MTVCEGGYVNSKGNVVLECGVELYVKEDKKEGVFRFYKVLDNGGRIYIDEVKTTDICSAINIINEKIRNKKIVFGNGWVAFSIRGFPITPYDLIEYSRNNEKLTIIEKQRIRHGVIYKGYTMVAINSGIPIKIIVYDREFDRLLTRELFDYIGEIIYNDGSVMIFRYFNSKNVYIIWYSGKAKTFGYLKRVLNNERTKSFIEYVKNKYSISDEIIVSINERQYSSGAIDFICDANYKKGNVEFNSRFTYHVSMFGKENEVYYVLEDFEIVAFKEAIDKIPYEELEDMFRDLL